MDSASNTDRTARLLHPSSERSDAPVSIEVLRDIAAGLASSFPAGTADLGRGEIRRHRLLATTGYDAWLVEFGPHAMIEPHDHEGSIGVTGVIEGRLVEFWADDHGSPRSRFQQVAAGDTIELGITHRHVLMNSTTQSARVVQAFSPPLGGDR
jgi:hypothetical protein